MSLQCFVLMIVIGSKSFAFTSDTSPFNDQWQINMVNSFTYVNSFTCETTHIHKLECDVKHDLLQLFKPYTMR
jgi:hypothetical protein